MSSFSSGDTLGANSPSEIKSPLEEIFGEKLHKKSEESRLATGIVIPTMEALQNKNLIGVLLMSRWSRKCAEFLELLIPVYNEWINSGINDIEIVFVTVDFDEVTFDEVYGGMPWLALPFEELEDKSTKIVRRIQLDDEFFIPQLAFMTPDGVVVHSNGVKSITKFGRRAYPFSPEQLTLLDQECLEEQNAALLALSPSINALVEGIIADEDSRKVGDSSAVMSTCEACGATTVSYGAATEGKRKCLGCKKVLKVTPRVETGPVRPKILCLALGVPGTDYYGVFQPHPSVKKLVECLKSLQETSPGQCIARYIEWENEGEQGHLICAHGIPNMPPEIVTPEFRRLLTVINSGNIIPPAILVLGIKDDGSVELLQLNAVDIILNQGLKAYPWSKAKVDALEQEKNDRISNLKTKAPQLDFLRSPGRDFLVRGSGAQAMNEDIDYVAEDNDIIALYFGATWCRMCAQFIELLKEYYENIRQMGRGFELILISSDYTQQQFDLHTSLLPGLNLPFSERQLKSDLLTMFDIKLLPTLVMINAKDGTFLTRKGVHAVVALKVANFDAWPYDEEKMNNINEVVKHSMDDNRDKLLAEEKAKEEEQEEVFGGTQGVMTRWIGEPGSVKIDNETRIVEFTRFATVSLHTCMIYSGETAYYEVEIKANDGVIQIGWATEQMTRLNKYRGKGVGDHIGSWSADGSRQTKWCAGQREGAFGTRWEIGDIIGVSISLLKKDRSFHISVNGNYDAPNGVVVRDADLLDADKHGVFAAISGQGYSIKVNFGEEEFRYAPPDPKYASVLNHFPENVFILK